LSEEATNRTEITVSMQMLPGGLQEIALYCGMEAAFLLVKEFGGMRIWVPAKYTSEITLNNLGETIARKIVDNFGGSSLEVPVTCYSAEGKRQMVGLLLNDGWSHNAIARRLGITAHQVARLIDMPPPKKGRVSRVSDAHLTPLPG